MSPLQASSPTDRSWQEASDMRSRRSWYAAVQFNAVVETSEHAVRLWESLGFTTLRVCTSTKSAASDITTSGRHSHTSLIVAEALA
jgi:hypothetical protein